MTDELEKDGEDSNIDRAAISQPACTAIQVALVDLLGSFGLFPSVVVGHSSGEIATAYVFAFPVFHLNALSLPILVIENASNN